MHRARTLLDHLQSPQSVFNIGETGWTSSNYARVAGHVSLKGASYLGLDQAVQPHGRPTAIHLGRCEQSRDLITRTMLNPKVALAGRTWPISLTCGRHSSIWDSKAAGGCKAIASCSRKTCSAGILIACDTFPCQ
jgi:hypothetical protein